MLPSQHEERDAEPNHRGVVVAYLVYLWDMVSLVGGEPVELQLLCLLLKERSRLRAPSAGRADMRAVKLHLLLWSANLTRCRKDGIGSFRCVRRWRV